MYAKYFFILQFISDSAAGEGPSSVSGSTQQRRSGRLSKKVNVNEISYFQCVPIHLLLYN